MHVRTREHCRYSEKFRINWKIKQIQKIKNVPIRHQSGVASNMMMDPRKILGLFNHNSKLLFISHVSEKFKFLENKS